MFKWYLDYMEKKKLTNVFYKSQNFISWASVSCSLILYLHTHFCFSYINILFPFVAVFSLHSEELAPLNRFSVTAWSRDAMRTCWSLPVSSAARPASPCSAPSPPAARSVGWRCPAWSPSARLRKNRYRGRETEKTRVLSQCQLRQKFTSGVGVSSSPSVISSLSLSVWALIM